MNKVLVKNNQYYVVKTTEETPRFLVRENKNSDTKGLPVWKYYFSTNPAKAIKCEDLFIADIMLDDYKKQINDELKDRYGFKVIFDDSAFETVLMVVSYQIGVAE